MDRDCYFNSGGGWSCPMAFGRQKPDVLLLQHRTTVHLVKVALIETENNKKYFD